MKDYSQKGLALAAGIKQENLSYIETNKKKSPMRKEVFQKIAKALDMTAEEIEQFEPGKMIVNHFEQNAKQDIFIQHLTINNHEKIMTLQNETIDTLQKLNDVYKNQLNKFQ